MKRKFFPILVMLSACLFCILGVQNVSANGNPPSNEAKMEWWKNAKFGMFIHWGLYAQAGGIWKDHTGYGEWIMNEAKIPCAEYAALAKNFNPKDFNAEEWVKLAKEAGQKYIVITSKHHEGFAMFKSDASAYNVYDATPFKRDVIDEMAKACRKYGMKLGLYYSQAQDWHHQGGAVAGGDWDDTHKGDMNKYIDEIAIPQVKEILSKYGDIAVLWWDTPVGMTEAMARKLHAITEQYPNLITNNRLGGNIGGDLETPEQYIPATGYPGRNWEVCMTMNDHWGYNAYDENWKSTKDLIRKLVDIVSKGGNFLLNVGPNRYGQIPVVCQKELRDMGEWLKTNGEAIYGTEASPFPYLPFGRATQKGNMLYLHIFQWNRTIALPCDAKVRKAYLLADRGTQVKSYVKDGITYFTLPPYAPDKTAAVLAVECAAPVATQTVPTAEASVVADGKTVKMMNDNNQNTRFEASSSKSVIEIDLKRPCNIQCLALVEPWHPWDGQRQSYTLEAQTNNVWTKVAEGETAGTGVTVPLKRIKAQLFRLTVEHQQGKATLGEVVLYR
jgi:alpha-L-fucosidase